MALSAQPAVLLILFFRVALALAYPTGTGVILTPTAVLSGGAVLPSVLPAEGLVGKCAARHPHLVRSHSSGRHARCDRLVWRVKGFYPFPQGIKGPVAWLFRDTHQAISVSTAGGESKLLIDFMTEGGQAHPVWWDEAVKWRVLLGGSIRGEVRVRGTGEVCEHGTKLHRLAAAATAYDSRMNLYTNNCRIFCARMEREAQRLNDEDADDAGLPSARCRIALADARLALAIANAAALPMLYPASILLLCWNGLRDL